MNSLRVIASGLLILSAFLMLTNAWTMKPAPAVATAVFIAIWAVISALNLWIGVHYAGYTVREELPILAAVFLVPALVSLAVSGLLLRP
jgi:apolipoprotein N-acyltransferase